MRFDVVTPPSRLQMCQMTEHPESNQFSTLLMRGERERGRKIGKHNPSHFRITLLISGTSCEFLLHCTSLMSYFLHFYIELSLHEGMAANLSELCSSRVTRYTQWYNHPFMTRCWISLLLDWLHYGTFFNFLERRRRKNYHVSFVGNFN